MDHLRELFDYQRFRKNTKLEAHIGEVYDRYLADSVELNDDELELIAAAGEQHLHENRIKVTGASGSKNGQRGNL